ncbi:MAG: hypothetical protein IGR92_15125 [Leptolyngbyaceae cyanobacterium T60_A2020_046]|nr:hypothetical protein [Leptolyngbyaceae cyanobacterium T60_A2020_046]
MGDGVAQLVPPWPRNLKHDMGPRSPQVRQFSAIPTALSPFRTVMRHDFSALLPAEFSCPSSQGVPYRSPRTLSPRQNVYAIELIDALA